MLASKLNLVETVVYMNDEASITIRHQYGKVMSNRASRDDSITYGTNVTITSGHFVGAIFNSISANPFLKLFAI